MTWLHLPVRRENDLQASRPGGIIATVKEKENFVAKCETCGNEYDRTFTVTRGDRTATFDSFECAVQALAPQCAHCGCRILGHGIEVDETIFCCAHCARESGHDEPTDRVAAGSRHS